MADAAHSPEPLLRLRLWDLLAMRVDFTAYMALINVTIFYTGQWQGWMIERRGYPATLMADAAAGLLCLAVLPFLKPAPREARVE